MSGDNLCNGSAILLFKGGGVQKLRKETKRSKKLFSGITSSTAMEGPLVRVSDSCNSCDCHNQRGRILQVLLHYWVRPEMNRTIPHIRQIQCRSHCYSGNQHQIQVLYDNVKTSEKNHLSKWLLHEKVPKKTAPVLVFPSKSLTAKKPAKHCKNHTTWKLKKLCGVFYHLTGSVRPLTLLLPCWHVMTGWLAPNTDRFPGRTPTDRQVPGS